MESHFLFVIENVDKEVYDFSKLQQFCDLMGFSFCKGEPICKDKYLEASPDERIFCQPDEYIYDHVAHIYVESQTANDQYNAASLLGSLAASWGYEFLVAHF